MCIFISRVILTLRMAYNHLNFIRGFSPSPACMPHVVRPDVSLVGDPREPLKEGDRLQLNCTADTAYPRSSLVWLFGNTPVIESDRTSITTTTVQDEQTGFYTETSVLTIGRMLSEDSGRYTCRADLFIPGEPSPVLSAVITVQGIPVR